jgi:Dolichyl-phosphate-mannose-protein mannosyltransferase
MLSPGHARLRPWHIVLAWMLLLTPLARWGLPSREADATLFGGRPAWTAEQFSAAGAVDDLRSRAAGADTDRDPLAASEVPIDLTATDARRAEILLRYRLYSEQPDEMITFRALQRMKPRQGDFDPRLFQYGGAYVYLVGAALVAGRLCGWLTLTSDLSVYLANPALFGEFFFVARLLSIAAAGLALLAVERIARRAAGPAGGWVALLFAAASPVLLSGALEAKPHVPSLAAALWAIDAALSWTRDTSRRASLRMGVFAGLSAGFVLTGFAALATIACAGLAAATRGGAKAIRGAVLAGLLAVLVYAATNPYLLWNLFFQRDVLQSNLGNTGAMYRIAELPAGLANVAGLLRESVGLGVVTFAAVGGIVALRRRRESVVVAAAAGLAMLVFAVALGAGKPPEFGRFLVLPAALMCIAAGIGIAGTQHRVVIVMMTVGCLLSMNTWDYARALWNAGTPHSARLQAARWIEANVPAADAIGVLQEPAPYSGPPIDFSRRAIVLVPHKSPSEALPAWLVLAADAGLLSKGLPVGYETVAAFPSRSASGKRIAWADKPIWVLRRRE